MRDQSEQPPKGLSVSLTPDVFHSLAWYARRYEMSPRVFLAHLAEQYIAAMKKAEPADRGR